MEELERFENDLFDKDENMETDYYPKMKPPGGNASGGTAAWISKKAGRTIKKPHAAVKDKIVHKHNGARSLMVQARTFEDSVSSNGEDEDILMLLGHNVMVGKSMESSGASQPSMSRDESGQSQYVMEYDGDGIAKRRRLHVNYNLVDLSERSTHGTYFDNGKWTSQQPRKRKRKLEGESGRGASESGESQSDSSGLVVPTRKKPGRPVGWRKNKASVPAVTVTKPGHVPTSVSISHPQSQASRQIQPQSQPTQSQPPPQTQPQTQIQDQTQSHPDSQEASTTSQYENEVFEVEKIVDSRMQNGKIQYCVKWVGYDHAANDWLTESSMEGCDRLIQDFKRRRKKEEEERKKRQRKEEGEGEEQPNIMLQGI